MDNEVVGSKERTFLFKEEGYKVGYIINFGHYPLVEHERFAR